MKKTLRSININALSMGFILLLSLSFTYNSHAVVRTWDGGGGDNQFSTDANWSGDVVPGATDDVIFDGTSVIDCIIDQPVSVASFSMNVGYSGTIADDGNENAFSSSNFNIFQGIFDGTSLQSILIGGTFNQNGGTFITTINNTTFRNTFSLTSGTFTAAQGLVVFSTNDFTINNNPTFYNVRFAGTSPGRIFTIASFITVNNLSFSGTFAVNVTGGTINVKGSISNTGTGLKTINSITNFNGTTTQTVAIPANVFLTNINFNNAVGAFLGANLTSTNVTGNIFVQTGILDNGGFSVVGNPGRIFQVDSNATLKVGAPSTGPSGFGTVTHEPTSTVEYYGTTAQTITAGNFGNLLISGIRGSNSITLPNGTIEISGLFNPSATFELNFSPQYITTGNTIKFTGAGQTIPAFSFNNLTIELVNSLTARSTEGPVSINGTLNLSSGILQVGGTNTLDIYGPVVQGAGSIGVYTGEPVTSPRVRYSGSAGQAVATGIYYNLEFTTTATRDLTNKQITVLNVFTPGPGSGHIVTGSDFIFGGTSPQDVPAFNYNKLILQNSTTKTLTGIITLNSDLTDETSSGFTAGTSTVIFGDTLSSQGMTGPADPMIFNNLTINNPNGTKTYKSTTINGTYNSTGEVGLIIFPNDSTPNNLTFANQIGSGAIVTGGPKADLTFTSGQATIGTLHFNQREDTSNVIRFLTMSANSASTVAFGNPMRVVGTTTLTSGTINSNGNMTQDLNTGYISEVGTGSISGNMNTIKNVTHDYYSLIGAPLAGVTPSDLTDDFTVARIYNETVHTQAYSDGYQLVNTNSFQGRGYALNRAAAGTTTMDMTGTYEHNPPVVSTFGRSVSVPVTYTSTSPLPNDAKDGWNLIGNPFPSTVNWEEVDVNFPVGQYRAIYIYDGANRRYVSYRDSIASISGFDTLNILAPMQGFWYKYNCSDIPTGCSTDIVFPKSAREVGTRPLFREESTGKSLIRLHLEGANSMDGTVIVAENGSSEDFDYLDASKFMNDRGVSVYTKINRKNFSINSVPTDYNKSILVRYQLPVTGEYTFKAVDLADAYGIGSVTLTDKLLNITQDLKSNPNYTFTAEKGDTTSRFYINYTSNLTTTIQDEANVSVTIGGDGKKVFINSNGGYKIKGDISLYDVLGKEVYKVENVEIKRSISIEPNLPSGVYSVKLITSDQNQYNGKISINY